MMMVLMDPVIGVVSGCVLGLFAVVAAKLIAPRSGPAVTVR